MRGMEWQFVNLKQVDGSVSVTLPGVPDAG
nr:MAG TPA: hypothetical protein [Caudoviricetes sp.]